MWLHEDFVDLLEIHGFGLIAHGFDEGGDTEIPGPAEEALCRTDDQGKRILGECIMSETGQIELVENEALDDLWSQPGQQRGIGDTGSNFLVDREGQCLHERRLADQDQIMTAREVLEEESQLSETVGLHEMGVVNLC